MSKKLILRSILSFSLIVTALLITPVAKASPANIHDEAKLLTRKAPDLNQKAIEEALIAYYTALKQGHDHKHILTIIDYSKPSTQQRLWSFDMNYHSLLFHTFVAHGKGSGLNNATSFSNKGGTRKSSLGLFATGTTYYGHKGYSLRLKGLEPGINDHAMRRNIVIHGASYVSQSVANTLGRLGRSWACPAVPKRLAKSIINTLKNDTLVFAYYPDQHWLTHSKYLNS